MTSRSLLEHRQDVVARLNTLTPLDLPLADAIGGVLARDAIAPRDVPAVAIAQWDGYAVRAQDTAHANSQAVTLPVSHDVAPGAAPTRLAPGAAARVARGSAVPLGADAVVARPTDAATAVVLDAEVPPGQGIDPAGSYAHAGEIIVAAGTRLTPGHVSAMLACSVGAALVTPAPRVVIVTVGSELVQRATTSHPSLTPDQPVPDASGALLAALVTGVGGRVVRVVAVPDEAGALRQAVDDAALQADLVVTVGGTSDDWRDVVMPVLTGACGAVRYQVRLSPGDMHAIGQVGDRDGRPVVLLAIPGHPVDVAAAFAGYVRDAILTLRGADTARESVPAATGWHTPYGYAHVVPVVRSAHAGHVSVEPVVTGREVTLRDLARADGLAVVDESVTQVTAGDQVDVVWWS